MVSEVLELVDQIYKEHDVFLDSTIRDYFERTLSRLVALISIHLARLGNAPGFTDTSMDGGRAGISGI